MSEKDTNFNAWIHEKGIVSISENVLLASCLTLLWRHSQLYPEEIRKLRKYRDSLWTYGDAKWREMTSGCAEIVYAAISTNETVKDLIKEIWQHYDSDEPHKIAMFMRVMAALLHKHAQHLEPTTKEAYTREVRATTAKVANYLDSCIREHRISSSTSDKSGKQWEHDGHLVASLEKASACVLYGDSTLETYKLVVLSLALLHLCPQNRRKNLIVYPILKMCKERQSIILHLIMQTCDIQNSGPNIDDYHKLWRELFDSKNGEDKNVVEYSKFAFDDYFAELRNILNSNSESMCQMKMAALFDLTVLILSLEHDSFWFAEIFADLIDVIDEFVWLNGFSYGLIEVIAVLISIEPKISEDVTSKARDTFKDIISKLSFVNSADEKSLCAIAKCFIYGHSETSPEITNALHVVFSRNNVDSDLLLEALNVFAEYGSSKSMGFNEIFDKIEKFMKMNTVDGKNRRVVRKKALLAISKHQKNLSDLYLSFNVDALDINIKRELKISITDVVKVCLKYENTNLLRDLILLSNSNIDTTIQILYKICICLSRGEGNATEFTNYAIIAIKRNKNPLLIVNGVLNCLKITKNPGTRKFLCAIIEVLLAENHMNNADVIKESILVAENFLRNDESGSMMAAVDVVSTVIPFLNKHNELIVIYLIDLVLLILKIKLCDYSQVYDECVKLLIEKSSLFNETIIETTIKRMFSTQPRLLECNSVATFNNITNSSLNFLQSVYQKNPEKYLSKFLETILKNDNIECLHQITEFKRKLNIDLDTSRKILYANDSKAFSILERVYMEPITLFEIIYKFILEFGDGLLEIFYQKTVLLLNKILTLHPLDMLMKYESTLVDLFEKYNPKIQSLASKQISEYTVSLDFTDITKNLENFNRQPTNSDLLRRLVFISKCVDISNIVYKREQITKWPKLIKEAIQKESFINGVKVDFLTAAMTISLWSLEDNDIVLLIADNVKSGNVEIGMKCFKLLVAAFVDCFLNRPTIIQDDKLTKHLKDITTEVIKFCNKKVRNQYKLNCIVDSVWPKLENLLTAIELKEIFILFSNKNKVESNTNPSKWVLQLMSSDNSDLNTKTHMMDLLPEIRFRPTSDVELAIKSFADNLPLKLSELSDHAPVESVFRAIVLTCNPLLLNPVIKCCLDQNTGWWDTIIEKSVENIAQQNCAPIMNALFETVNSDLVLLAKLCVIDRLLYPMLENAKPNQCEVFFENHLEVLLKLVHKELRNNQKTTQFLLQKYYTDYYIGFKLLSLLFVKMSEAVLESSESVLYKKLITFNPDSSWWLVRSVSKAAVTLRAKVQLPQNADKETNEYYRKFHCANFNCLAAAILKKDPDASKYSFLFQKEVFVKFVDTQKIYNIPLRSKKPNKRHATIASTCQTDMSNLTFGTSLSVQRSPLFYRTLSDNVLQYDFLKEDSEERDDTVFLVLVENELNSHECVPTLSAILKSISNKTTPAMPPYWIVNLAGIITEAFPDNVKMLIAQSICNCYRDLIPFSKFLVVPLLNFVEKRIFDGLTANTLEAILEWCERDESILNDSVMKTFLSCFASILQDKQLIERDGYNLINLFEKIAKLLNGSTDLCDTISIYINEVKDLKTVKIGLKILKTLQLNNFSSINLCDKLRNVMMGKRDGTCDFVAFKMAAEAYGRAIFSYQNDSLKMAEIDNFNKVFLPSFKAVKMDVYVDLLYNVQNVCENICDDSNIRVITDASSKMPRELRRKCIKILTNYIKCQNHINVVKDIFSTINIEEIVCSEIDRDVGLELIHAGLSSLEDDQKRRYVNIIFDICHGHSSCKVGAFKVLVKAAEDYLNTYKRGREMAPPSKRPKLERTSTDLIQLLLNSDSYNWNLFTVLSDGLGDPAVASVVFDGVKTWLDGEELGLRFCECVLLTCASEKRDRNTRTFDLRKRVSAILRLFLQVFSTDEDFLETILFEENVSTARSSNQPTPVLSRILSKASLHQGSFASRASFVRQTVKRTNMAATDKNIKLYLKDFVEDLLSFAEMNDQTAIQTYKVFLTSLISNPRFPRKTFAEVLKKCMNNTSSDVCEVLIFSSRYLVNECLKMDGWKTVLQDLAKKCKGTNLEVVTSLALEDTQIAEFPYDFYEERIKSQIIFDEKTNEFTYNGLMSAFDQLSNWDLLTFDERRNIQVSLPPLWCCQNEFNEKFESALAEPIALPDWILAMSSVINEKETSKLNIRLLQANTTPVNYFDRSAIAESIEWFETKRQPSSFRSDTFNEQCLAKWAARLMLRRLLTTLPQDSDNSFDGNIDTETELAWCKAALGIGLCQPVLQCVKRNASCLAAEDLLPWLTIQTKAEWQIAKCEHNRPSLSRICAHAEEFYSKCSTKSTNDSKAEMLSVLMGIKSDICMAKLEENSYDTTESITSLNELCDRVDSLSVPDAWSSKQHKLLLEYYDAVMEKGILGLSTIWSQCGKCLSRILDRGIHFDSNGATAVVLMKIIQNGAKCEELEKFLCILEKSFTRLDPIILDALKELQNNEDISRSCKYAIKRLTANVDMNADLSKWLSLIRVPSYSLKLYCEDLLMALENKNESTWKSTLESIKNDFLDQEGAAYRLLIPYMDKLTSLKSFDLSPDFKCEAFKVLQEILRENCEKETNILQLADVCPALVRASERDGSIHMFGEQISSIEKEIKVLTSKRRPCLITVMTFSGKKRRWLIKSHDDLHLDAACQRLRRLTGLTGAHVKGYQVIPLTKNCGVIEWLENCATIREMICRKINLKDIFSTIRRESDLELIRAPSASALASYREIRSKIPAGCLRSSIEEECWCLDQFWQIKKQFLKSLASMAITDWLLGIGDRHLENILFDIAHGYLVSIDNSQVLGSAISNQRAVELPPARLTPAFLAVSMQGLEASTQIALKQVRENWRFLSALTYTAFFAHAEYDQQSFKDKLLRVKRKMSGEALSFETSLEELNENSSDVSLYTELLQKLTPNIAREAFGVYSVEQQISSLLNQSTNEKILAITRSGWEPWV